MKPEEYEDYLTFFSSLNLKPLQKIYLGLDFFGTNEYARYDFQKPLQVIQNAKSNIYFLKMLFSLDNACYGWKNLKNRYSLREDYYDRYNVKYSVKRDDQVFGIQVSTYRENVYGKYSYDSCFKDRLKKLKQNFPNVAFCVFTTPVSDALLNLLTECGRIDDYVRWLREINEVFGSFDHFMVPSELSHNSDRYFLDSHHLSPEGTRKLIQFIEKCEETAERDAEKDIGIRLTPDNIEDYIDLILYAKTPTSASQP